jgi:hypothetical protein
VTVDLAMAPRQVQAILSSIALIPGRVTVDLFPNGTMRMVFIAHSGGGDETPLTAHDLDAAEVVFMTCGLTPDHAAALRTELKRNKVASVETSIGEAIAANFRYARP